VVQARADRFQSRSELLPNVAVALSENAAKINLAAQGLSASTFGAGGSIANLFPRVVGPFHYYDAHASLDQNLFDLTAIRNLKSSAASLQAAELEARQSREEVVLAVTALYLQALAIDAEIDAQQSEVEYARASSRQASAQAEAGSKAPIEASRSLVELQTEELRLRAQRGTREKLKNQLARAIGLPLGLTIQFAEKLAPLEPEPLSVEAAMARAWTQRQDLQAVDARRKAAVEARPAASAQYLPTASIRGQYGIQGENPNSGNGVFQASAGISIPIFQGGRTQADTLRADSVLQQRTAELADQRGAIEADIRNAFVDLDVANDQVVTADSNRKLALENVRQSQDRFAVGVAESVELVSSQQSLAAADHDYISALFSLHLAHVALAHAMGESEKGLADLFKRN
jgi:outer membrane protein TolC